MSRGKSSLFTIHRNFFSREEQEVFSYLIPWIEWQRCPKWLGNFASRPYGEISGKSFGRLPRDIKMMTDRMAALVPGQHFTTAFIQKYEVGQGVKPHRDPKSNLGYTVLGAFGEWEGAETVLEKHRFTLRSGDALVQRCYIKSRRRPLHRVSEVTKGIKYSLIINTISQSRKGKAHG
jgi:hypothetical protein